MRASKIVKSEKFKVKSENSQFKNQNPKLTEIHISGAEGLYRKAEINRIVRRYIERALCHPKGLTDKIVVTIENIKQRPDLIESLPVSTVFCRTPAEGKRIIKKIIQSLGISKRSTEIAFEIIKKGNMRGAAIISAEKAERIEPDHGRGVRVSRLGISPSALTRLSLALSRHKINTDTVKEAIILASKVASCTGILAELCVSDNPDYTTGYVASQKFGYVRIPHIKQKGKRIGGRAFFIKEGVNAEDVIHYLEEIPVIITKVSSSKGLVPLYEILNYSHK